VNFPVFQVFHAIVTAVSGQISSSLCVLQIFRTVVLTWPVVDTLNSMSSVFLDIQNRCG